MSLDADDVPIIAFSQVLSDAFAGRSWLDVLTVLDSDAVNNVQITLATMVADGRCHSIVTTNFDTLLEQACALTGVDLPVVVPGAGSTLAPDAPAIHKIHGCVRTPESMVDRLFIDCYYPWAPKLFSNGHLAKTSSDATVWIYDAHFGGYRGVTYDAFVKYNFSWSKIKVQSSVAPRLSTLWDH